MPKPRVSSYFEEADVGTAQIDPGARFIAVNGRFCEITGYSRDELVGKMGPFDLDHPDDVEADRERIARFLRREDPIYFAEKRYLRKGGELVWVRVSVAPILNSAGEILHTAAVVEDITDQKYAQATLREKEARLRLFTEHAPAALAMFDREMRYLAVSRRWLTDFGLGQRNIIGLSHYDVFPEVPDRWREAHRRGLAGDVVQSTEDRFIRSGGEVQWSKWEVRPWRDADETVGGIVIFSEDITERKHQEAQQQFLMQELDHRVNNMLSLITAVVMRSRVGRASLDDYSKVIEDRVQAMAHIHRRLSENDWRGADLSGLVNSELGPYASAGNSVIAGPEVSLKPAAAQAVMMVLHELTTNAAKYGALSVDDGTVSVHWHRTEQIASENYLVIEWAETGGPPVKPLSTAGFGSSLIRDLVPFELRGNVDLVLAPEGVRCRIEIPLKHVVANSS